MGLQGELGFFVPFIGTVVALQLVLIWVLIWEPTLARLICHRLEARGISAPQIASAILLGISDPRRSSFRKFTLVEDDVGALWITPDQLIYWGDADQFAIARDQLLGIERKA